MEGGFHTETLADEAVITGGLKRGFRKHKLGPTLARHWDNGCPWLDFSTEELRFFAKR